MRESSAFAPILVRGVGDVASVVAVLLFRAGSHVALHDEPDPSGPRRGMAFVDAVFEGEARLDGIIARRIDDLTVVVRAMIEREAVPVTVAPFDEVLKAISWSVIVDGRLRKRTVPEVQRGLAPLTIGLGPNFVAGTNVDLAIETSWGGRLGAVIRNGPTLPLAGEPRPLSGIGRERFVYAPVAGCFETAARIGSQVVASQVIARIGDVPLSAPFAGTIRGLTHSGVPVTANAKVIEIDPRGDPSGAFGLGERARRIAEGVCRTIAEHEVGAMQELGIEHDSDRSSG